MGADIHGAFHGPLAPSWALHEQQAVAYGNSSASVYDRRVPRIADKNLDGVAFLFRTRQEAKKRARGGGSAFLVGRKLARSAEAVGHTMYLPYLVSNKHVVVGGSACVASVNRRDGGPPDIWDIDQNDWFPHPNGDDLAATCVVEFFDGSIHKTSFIPEGSFINQDVITHFNVGMGDEIFMIGRFYNMQGRSVNRPALRTGSLSMMLEPIWDSEEKRLQDSFAVEMRSKEGFSGSPVIVWRKPWTVLDDTPDDRHDFWALLGVNWGYILDENGENTQLNGVVPAWRISEILDSPDLKKVHAEHEEIIAASIDEGDNGIQKSSYVEIDTDIPADNPSHEEDFSRLLDAAAQTPKSDGQT